MAVATSSLWITPGQTCRVPDSGSTTKAFTRTPRATTGAGNSRGRVGAPEASTSLKVTCACNAGSMMLKSLMKQI
eukprot:CAMPEP_0117084820 /NCGR_PEP_ID=MMETSP0472-20121206/59688_1 /TAXON_ID=693140 ORGANISM="Tiarina fusus, Strain LIS" /NCGR_SAMPLE_ID=MMETSP0472 /ASSEMBLY_ACC=CAM_ASM_000603 /LENGTH=74 /DNA_ID=CAMNT_0004813947 /DNA_START=89 /DNA_END=313 /DNA_ORIENTATION=+